MKRITNIVSSLEVKGKTFRNRVIVPAMASQTANVIGEVTLKTLDHYRRLTKANASLVIVEYSYVHESGRSEINQLGVDKDDKLASLRKLSSVLKSNNNLAGIQLTHAGAKSSTVFTKETLISPSGVIVPDRIKEFEKPRIANIEDIELIKKSFDDAARRAVIAGFDLIEIHAAHGYGLNQWLSPFTNRRKDKYGGSFFYRARLLFEIINSIKDKFGNRIISVRIPGKDYIEGGFTQEDAVRLSFLLQDAGVDIINVSSGLGGWRRPRGKKGEGYLVDLASYVQQRISLPVVGVGGIKTKEYVNDQLLDNSFSFAAIGRAILENPLSGKKLLYD